MTLKLQVKAIFGTGKKKVAGCLVDSGKLTKGSMIEVVRGSGKDKATVFTGKLASLRRIKDTVDEVRGWSRGGGVFLFAAGWGVKVGTLASAGKLAGQPAAHEGHRG